MDVVTAFADLRELGRFRAILFGWPACDRVEADVSGFPALENPCVRAVFPLDEFGGVVLVFGRDVLFEQVRRFDQVIVYGYQYEVLHFHVESLP